MESKTSPLSIDEGDRAKEPEKKSGGLVNELLRGTLLSLFSSPAPTTSREQEKGLDKTSSFLSLSSHSVGRPRSTGSFKHYLGPSPASSVCTGSGTYSSVSVRPLRVVLSPPRDSVAYFYLVSPSVLNTPSYTKDGPR